MQVTHAQTPSTDLETAVTQINVALNSNAILAGIAIHDWPGYVQLLNNGAMRAAAAKSAPAS